MNLMESARGFEGGFGTLRRLVAGFAVAVATTVAFDAGVGATSTVAVDTAANVGESTSVVLDAAENPVTSSATGSGHMVRPDGTFRSFSFAAVKHADGSVRGELQLNSRGFDVFVHIAIDCLRVEGNTAYMSGLITHSSNPDEGVVGELNRWAVQDNGEGTNADPDLVSSIPENEGNADEKTCEDDNSDRPLNRVVQLGNVRVTGT